MSISFEDPDYRPPADIQGADARAYEEKILKLLRAGLLTPPPGRPIQLHWSLGDGVAVIDSIELQGEPPNTAIVIRYHGSTDPSERIAIDRFWPDPVEPPDGRKIIDDPASIAGWIFADWVDGYLQPSESGEQELDSAD